MASERIYSHVEVDCLTAIISALNPTAMLAILANTLAVSIFYKLVNLIAKLVLG